MSRSSARALAARLREHGYTVDLILSHRPGEHSSRETVFAVDTQPRRQILPMVRRVIRPIAEILTMARHPLAVSRDVRVALNLVRIEANFGAVQYGTASSDKAE